MYAEFSKIIDLIKYFENKQDVYRYRTSQYMLGAFAIVGALYFTKIGVAHSVPLIATIIVPWLAVVLIFTLLRLDLVQYEQLRLSALSEAIRLETEHSWLPPFHRRLIDEDTGAHHGSGHKKVNFYLGVSLILMLTSALSLSLLPMASTWYFRTGIAVGTLGIFYLYRMMVLKVVPDASEVMKRIKDL